MYDNNKSVHSNLVSSRSQITRRRLLQAMATSSLLVIGGGALTACGGSSTPGETKVNLVTAAWPFEAMPTADQQKKDPSLKAYASTLDNWLKKNPGVSITKSSLNIWDQSQLSTAVSAGTAPTWFPGNVLGGWNDINTRSAFIKGMAADVTSQVEKYSLTSKITKAAIDPYKKWAINGKYYSVPTEYVPASMGLYFRRDLFKEAGLAEPKVDWTWEDVRTAAQKLTKDKRKGIATQAWAISGIRDAEQLNFLGTIPSPSTGWHWRYAYTEFLPEWIKTSNLWRDMYIKDKSISSDVSYTDASILGQFVNNNVAMFLNNSGFFTRPATDASSLASFAKKQGKPLDDIVGFISMPRGTNGAPTTTQPFVPQLSFDPSLQRKPEALNKALSLYEYMYFGQGYTDQRKGTYESTKDIQAVFNQAVPLNGLTSIPGIPGSLEDAWGKQYMQSIKQCTEIPLMPNSAWYFPAEKNAGPTGTSSSDANNALAFTSKDITSIVKNLESVSNKEVSGLSSSISADDFKKAAKEYYAAYDAFFKQHAPEFYTNVFAPWYQQKVVPVL